MTGPTPPERPPRAAPGSDPSMEDILGSIRRILSEDEAAPAPASAEEPAAAEEAASDDMLLLDTTLMVPVEPPAPTAPPPPPFAPPRALAAADAATVAEPEHPMEDPMTDASLTAPSTAAVVASSIDELVRTLSADGAAQVHRGGPTIEDLVREELRPLVKAWLDHHLPAMVERLVREEIGRVIARGVR